MDLDHDPSGVLGTSLGYAERRRNDSKADIIYFIRHKLIDSFIQHMPFSFHAPARLYEHKETIND